MPISNFIDTPKPDTSNPPPDKLIGDSGEHDPVKPRDKKDEDKGLRSTSIRP